MGAGTIAIEGRDLSSTLVVLDVVGAAPAARPLFGSARLMSVDMWAAATAATSPATVAVIWADETSGINREVSDTSMSPMDIAHVHSKPPRDHPSSFWRRENDSNVMCYLTVTNGTIIDIVIEGVLQDGALPANSPAGVAFTGVLGVVYAMPLDTSSNLPGARILVPQGLRQFGN